jgi:hypothetical protein
MSTNLRILILSVRYSIWVPIQYLTVYEIAQRTPDWPFACIGLIPLIAGAVIIWGKRRFKWTQPHWLFAIFCCLFGAFWVVVVGSSTLLADSDAFVAYQRGEYQTVKGVVTDFHPMPYEGHQDECFSVQDQRFCYSDYEIAPGFHNAATHGPIRAGLPVRIAYRDGRILKLEIPSGLAPTPAQSAAITAEGERQWQQRAVNDPFEQKINTAALFTAVCWTLWWNLQWKRVMRFWLKPPYRPWVAVVFRLFFALNFLGAVVGFARQLRSHPLTKQDVGPTIQIAAIMCVLVALMSAYVLWMAQRRDAKTARCDLPTD